MVWQSCQNNAGQTSTFQWHSSWVIWLQLCGIVKRRQRLLIYHSVRRYTMITEHKMESGKSMSWTPTRGSLEKIKKKKSYTQTLSEQNDCTSQPALLPQTAVLKTTKSTILSLLHRKYQDCVKCFVYYVYCLQHLKNKQKKNMVSAQRQDVLTVVKLLLLFEFGFTSLQCK